MSIFFLILALFVGAVASGVLISYLMAWTQRANCDPVLIEKRFRPSSLWLAFRLIVFEILFLVLTLLLRPFGWSKQRPSQQRTPGASPGSTTPVLLLHGLFHNRASMFWLRSRLRRNGFPEVYALNLPLWGNLESATETVARKVDELRIHHGIEKVHLVGHSMGGMVARNYVQVRGGARNVDRCILLGTPNEGSLLAPLAVTPLGRCLVRGSEFLQRLASSPLPEGVRMASIYSRHDNLVVPYDNARLIGVHNVELTGIGHTALLYHPRATKALIHQLKEAS